VNKIKIRKLKQEDLKSLDRLYYYFWNEHSNTQLMNEKFSELSNNDDYIFLVAEVNNVIAGSILGIICHELYGNCRPFLLMEDLIVDENFRKMGIGKKLINELETIAKQKNCYRILFLTEADRKGTIEFYESIGFDSKKNIGFKRHL
jgi:ribosomal protein S18 acetylase RimI-like enzyme